MIRTLAIIEKYNKHTPMKAIERSKLRKFGKTYQVSKNHTIPAKTYSIQTYGPRRPHTHVCTSVHYLNKALLQFAKRRLYRSIVVDSVETLPYSKRVVVLFRYLNILGISLYLVTTGTKTFWYADERL